MYPNGPPPPPPEESDDALGFEPVAWEESELPDESVECEEPPTDFELPTVPA